MFPRTEKFALTMPKLFSASQNAKNTNHRLSEFFNNSSMARILDAFLDNPDTSIYTIDLLNISGLSRKSLWVNMPQLFDLEILIEEGYKTHKFYRLNKNNEQVKQISKFREVLTRVR